MAICVFLHLSMRLNRLFSSLRTRILGWYILLVAASMLVSIIGIRQTLLARQCCG
ncbi:MAG: hypothetical protein SNJ50_00795 [Cyanobacteriota bacterium]